MCPTHWLDLQRTLVRVGLASRRGVANRLASRRFGTLQDLQGVSAVAERSGPRLLWLYHYSV